MLHRPHFTELFLKRFLSRPRLIFVLEEAYNEWSIFSSPQPQNPYENSSSLVVAADFHMKFHAEVNRKSCSYASGLVYFPDVWISRGDDEDTMHVICNPITGQYAILPNLIRHRRLRSVLGFDPIDKEFKVLAEDLPFPYLGQGRIHKILTLGLGTGKPNWKGTKNRCPSYDYSFCEGICINGVWYYLVEGHSNEQIVCVDVRSEEFKIIN